MCNGERKIMDQEQPSKSGKPELFMACLGTAVAVNILIIIVLELFASTNFMIFYFDKYIPVIVTFLVFIIFWPIYSKRMKHSSTWSKYYPFD
jgi:hypothetical protein